MLLLSSTYCIVMCSSTLLLCNGVSLVIRLYMLVSNSLLSKGTSLIYTVYNNADSLLPCIPEQSNICNMLEFTVSIDTYCDLLDKKVV